MIDAALAERLALLLAGGAGDMSAQPDWFGARVERAAERIVEVTGLRPAGTLPSPEWLDRGGWAAANLASTGSLLNPLLDRVGENLGMLGGPARAGVSYIASAELGALLGIVGRRVLGQYELALLDPAVPPRLLFVGPNIDAVALGMDVERDELADWVIFHEVTHAVQFGGVPWLREHISALLRDLLGELELKVDAGTIAKMPTADDLKALAASVRDGGLLAVVGPGKRELLDRVQAIMALVEGHAEWTMDAAAEEVIPSLAKLRAALDARRRDRPPGAARARPSARARDEDAPVPGGPRVLRRRRRRGRRRGDARRVALAGGRADDRGAPGPVPVAGTAGAAGGLTLRAAGGPLHVDGLIAHLGPRAVPGMEEVDGATYRRVLRLPGGNGVVAARLSASGARGTLWLEDAADRRRRRRRALREPPGARRARRRGRRVLGRDPALAPLVAAAPGVRVPGTPDGAELAIRAVLGQQISVAAARTAAAGLAAGLGRPLPAPERDADPRVPVAGGAWPTRPTSSCACRGRGSAPCGSSPPSSRRAISTCAAARTRRPCAPLSWRCPASVRGPRSTWRCAPPATPTRSRRRTSACCARRRRWGCRRTPAGWRRTPSGGGRSGRSGPNVCGRSDPSRLQNHAHA